MVLGTMFSESDVLILLSSSVGTILWHLGDKYCLGAFYAVSGCSVASLQWQELSMDGARLGEWTLGRIVLKAGCLQRSKGVERL